MYSYDWKIMKYLFAILMWAYYETIRWEVARSFATTNFILRALYIYASYVDYVNSQLRFVH